MIKRYMLINNLNDNEKSIETKQKKNIIQISTLKIWSDYIIILYILVLTFEF